MTFYIKNMVCNRCKMAVQTIFENAGLTPTHIELGEVILNEETITPSQQKIIHEQLIGYGFEILDNQKSKTIERIKNLITDIVHFQNNKLDHNLSDYLTTKLHQDYSTISHLFSEVEGITIEKYYIHQKIEKVKELLVYDELSLSEIAFQLNYSSVAYLSNQFKKVTGLSPTHFKKLRPIKRKSLDRL